MSVCVCVHTWLCLYVPGNFHIYKLFINIPYTQIDYAYNAELCLATAGLHGI